MGILSKRDLILTFAQKLWIRKHNVKPYAECSMCTVLEAYNGTPGAGQTPLFTICGSVPAVCCPTELCFFLCSKRVLGYCTMYSYRSAHTADMWVNTPFSCRICHIMPSEICHSFFMLLQDPIFISTCMLPSGWRRKCYFIGTWDFIPKKVFYEFEINPKNVQKKDNIRLVQIVLLIFHM